MSKITHEQTMKAAIHSMGIAKTNGKLYRTTNNEEATLISANLVEMVRCTDKKQIEDFIDAMMESFKKVQPSIELWSFLCMNTNWLSWAWHAQGEDELSSNWADAWYKINDFSIETLKGDDLKKYLEITD